MPAFRGPDGKVLYVPEEEASRYRVGGDYQEIGNEAAGAAQSKIAPTDNGALGSIGAIASAGLSGATLGASDFLLKGALTQGQFEQLAQDRADNPVLAGTAQAAGMIVPALVSGGAATPAGALGKLAGEGIEAGRATGGALGVAQQLGAAGAEGAIGNAGIYLSDVALGDRDLTAEGVNGALGTGLLFGAAGVPVMHGIEAGTVAARRMFARYAQGGAQAASDATAAWTEQAQRHLEAFDQTADLAKARLAETQTAREQANLGRLRANAEMADARAFTPPQEFPGTPGAPSAPGATTSGASVEGAAGAGPTAPVTAVAGEPPDVAAARVLRDRAAAMGSEPITPEEIAALQAKIGKRTYSSAPAGGPAPNALDLLAQHPDVPTRVEPMPALPVTMDEAELGTRVAEYEAARRAFDEIHMQVDPRFAAAMTKIEAHQPTLDRMLANADQSDLDTLLGRVGGGAPGDERLANAMRGALAPELDLVGPGGVGVGEFGAPGARGVKSQDTLARIAAGTGREEVAAAAPADLTGAGGPRALRAQGTPPARSLGEVAAEQAPVPVEQPATAVGKRQAIVTATEPAAVQAPGPLEVRRVKEGRRVTFEAKLPDGSTRTLTDRGEVTDLVDSQLPPGFRHGPLLETHRDLAVEHGLPKDAASIRDNALYVARPSELADHGIMGNDIHPEHAASMAEARATGVKLEPIEVKVTPDGKYWLEEGNHRLNEAAKSDAPVAIKFKAVSEKFERQRGTYDISERIRAAHVAAPTAPADDDLLAALSGTKAAIDKGSELADIGGKESAAARAEQLARHPDTAERFMARAQAADAAAGPAAGPTRPPVNLPGRARVANRYRAVEPEGHPLATKQLEMAHDAALERATAAADPAERAAAAQEAKTIEKQMTQVGARPGAVEDVAAIAPALTRVEKAAAALTEALGEAAPAAAKEHAAAFRAAEDEASRKTTARIGQAADDAAGTRAAAQNRDPLAPPAKAPDDLLLGPSQKQQRIAAAQKAQREAGAAYAKARVAEAEAQIGAKQAAGAAAEARAKLGPPPEAGAAPRGQGLGHRVVQGAHMVGYAAELGSDLGIPGIPRPHDIPVIGPLLSAYLKYRALRAAAGRFVGRIPATGETAAAELAARTRDGVARAVDRSLGLLERNANTARVALTVGTLKATDALGKRLIDDGQPDAKDGASVSEQAAVRMREVAAVIANPSLVHEAIRVQGRALTDPDLIDALSNHLLTMFQHLNEVAPKGPPPNPFTGKQWTPSQADAVRFGQQVAIAKDPQVAFQMLEAGTLTPAGAATLQTCYRLLFQEGQQRIMQRAAELKNPVAYPDLLRLGRLFDVPLHPSLEPQNAAALAAAHTPATKPAPATAQASPPTPSIANPTSISSLYDAGGARRAGRI